MRNVKLGILLFVLSVLAGSAMAANSMIYGKIFDIDGITPVENATVDVKLVTLADGDSDYYTAMTNATGDYAMIVINNASLNESLFIFAHKYGKYTELQDYTSSNTSSKMKYDIVLKSHPECSDRWDNDGDGKIDYPDDSGCIKVSDNTEMDNDPSAGIGVSMETEDFVPLVFMKNDGCTLMHNNADNGGFLDQRVENYAFFGERIVCDIFVVDKNGVPEKLLDVYMTVSNNQEPSSDDIEVNCDYVSPPCSKYLETNSVMNPNNFNDPRAYNARIDEEEITCENNVETLKKISGIYRCILTVETQTSMYGEHWISAVAEDIDNQLGWNDEQEFWFLNPNIGLEVDGEIDFGVVRPDTVSYSKPLKVMNAADDGSGVLLNMYISGTDFVDSKNSGARCPTSNMLALKYFSYFATNGAYHTLSGYPMEVMFDGIAYGGKEGYYQIPYENGNEDEPGINAPDINGREEIIQGDGIITLGTTDYFAGNILSPGSDIALTFRLYLPAPCNGDFTEGTIYLWAEAV